MELGVPQLFLLSASRSSKVCTGTWSPVDQRRNSMKMYAVTLLLTSPSRTPNWWWDSKELFRIFCGPFKEVFQDLLYKFMHENSKFISSPTKGIFIALNAEGWVKLAYKMHGELDNCIIYIEGKVIGIVWPEGHGIRQTTFYNGHKCKHALKFQVFTAPRGSRVHLQGPEVDLHHDM